MLAVWIAVAAACCALCIWGISAAVRRSKQRTQVEQTASHLEKVS
jgi:hypothetical protein